MFSGLLGLDRALSAWIAGLVSARPLQWVLLALTTIGTGGFVWLGLAALGWGMAPRLVAARSGPEARLEVWRLRASLWRAVMAVLLALFLVESAKPLMARERPFVAGAALSPIVRWRPTTSSFPSGHAAMAAAGAVALARAWPPAAVPLAVTAGVIAFSRIGLGVHYAGDVVGGLLVGLLSASLAAPPSATASVRRRPG